MFDDFSDFSKFKIFVFFENLRKYFRKKFNFLHDEKIFWVQIFFYELEYASRVQKKHFGAPMEARRTNQSSELKK